jgi:hypothetical protein
VLVSACRALEFYRSDLSKASASLRRLTRARPEICAGRSRIKLNLII